MEVESAARRYLLGDTTVTGYVQARVHKWRLEEKVDGTGKSAIVVYRNNGWATPDPVTTQEYPILAVKAYSDATRDSTGEIVKSDAEDRAFALMRAISNRLRRQRGEWWGAVGADPGLLVVTCAPWKEPTLVTEKDRHGQTSGDPLGDAVYAYGEFALQVVHGTRE